MQQYPQQKLNEYSAGDIRWLAREPELLSETVAEIKKLELPIEEEAVRRCFKRVWKDSIYRITKQRSKRKTERANEASRQEVAVQDGRSAADPASQADTTVLGTVSASLGLHSQEQESCDIPPLSGAMADLVNDVTLEAGLRQPQERQSTSRFLDVVLERST